VLTGMLRFFAILKADWDVISDKELNMIHQLYLSFGRSNRFTIFSNFSDDDTALGLLVLASFLLRPFARSRWLKTTIGMLRDWNVA
jgi:hypothetical protein